jgi:hypothetical protein
MELKTGVGEQPVAQRRRRYAIRGHHRKRP